MATGKPQARRVPRQLPILADEAQKIEIIKQWVQEDHDQLALLAEDLGIADDLNRWYRLALALALKHEPAFKERAPQVKWTPVIRGMLVVEIERLTGDKRLTGKRPDNPSHTATWAAGILAARKPQPHESTVAGHEWLEFLHGGADPAEALRVQYSKFHDDKWARLCRQAFKLHTRLDTIAEWDRDLRDALKRE